MLLQAGALSGLQNDMLETPLHKAVFNTSCRLLVLLIERKKNVF